MDNTKKQKKTTEWERLEIFSGKLERDIRGKFHARMGTIKDGNDKNLTQAEKIKKWQEYRELYKKDPNEPDYHDGVVIHLQLDILECEVKQALGSITNNKVSAGDGIPAELFQILKDYAVSLQLIKINEKKCFNQYAKKFGKLMSGHRTEKVQCLFHSQIIMPKKVQRSIQLHLLHMLARLCSKAFKLGFSSM